MPRLLYNTNAALNKWEEERYARLMQRKLQQAKSTGYNNPSSAARCSGSGWPCHVLVLHKTPQGGTSAACDTDAAPDGDKSGGPAASGAPQRPRSFLAAVAAQIDSGSKSRPAQVTAVTARAQVRQRASHRATHQQPEQQQRQPAGSSSNTSSKRPAWDDRFSLNAALGGGALAVGFAGSRPIPAAGGNNSSSILEHRAPAARQQQAFGGNKSVARIQAKAGSSSKVVLSGLTKQAPGHTLQRYKELPADRHAAGGSGSRLQPLSEGARAGTPDAVAAAAAAALRLLSGARERACSNAVCEKSLSQVPRLPQLARRCCSANSDAGQAGAWGSNIGSRCASSTASSRGASRGGARCLSVLAAAAASGDGPSSWPPAEPHQSSSSSSGLPTPPPTCIVQQPSLALLGASMQLQADSSSWLLPPLLRRSHHEDGHRLAVRPAAAARLSCEGSADVLLGPCSFREGSRRSSSSSTCQGSWR